jgi:hypothetical protein
MISFRLTTGRQKEIVMLSKYVAAPARIKAIRNGPCGALEKLQHCRQLLGMAPPKEGSAEPAIQEDYRDRYERLTGRSLRECPVCHRGRMIAVKALPQVRSSPTIRNTS